MRSISTAILATAASLGAQEFPAHELFVGTSSFAGEDVARFGRDRTFLGHFDVANGVRDVAFGPDGYLYVSSFNQDRVFVIDGDGNEVRQIGANSNLDGPWGLAFGPEGRLYVASVNSDTILVFERSGTFVTEFSDPSIAILRHLAFGPDGRLYVSGRDISNVGFVLTFDAGGNFLGTFVGNLASPEGLAFDAAGRLYVATSTTIRVYDLEATLLDQFGTGTGLSEPHDLEVGPDGRLYAASFQTESIFAFDLQGNFVAEFGQNEISQPHGLAFAPKRALAKISALAGATGERLKLKLTGTFSFFPGTGRTMLALEPVQPPFETGAFVFEGFEVEADSTTRRVQYGTSAPFTTADRGITSIALEVTGSLVEGVFETKKAKGSLQGARAGFAFFGKVTVSKPLN